MEIDRGDVQRRLGGIIKV